MPLYDFECETCGKVTETVFSIDDFPAGVSCETCGGFAKKIIAFGHGGVLLDEPNWLDNSVRGALQDTDLIAKGIEKPIETRTEYKKKLDELGVAPVPAFREI